LIDNVLEEISRDLGKRCEAGKLVVAKLFEGFTPGNRE
jgi:hypothetical protein